MGAELVIIDGYTCLSVRYI